MTNAPRIVSAATCSYRYTYLSADEARGSWGTMSNPSEARLAEVVAVLSMATDLGTGQPIERGIRTCLAGVKLAEVLGVDAQVISDSYYTLALSALRRTADA